MKINLKLFVPVLGSLLLFGAGIKLYQKNLSSVGTPPYRASALDVLGVSEQVVPVVENSQEEAPAQTETISIVTSPDVPVPSAISVVASEPATSPIIAAPVPISFGIPTVVAAPIITSSVGAGGTLANRPVIVETPAVQVVGVVEVQPLPEVFECIPSGTSQAGIVISELFIDMVGADTQEFIKLHNPTDAVVSLASSSLQYLSGSASSTALINKKNFLAGASIAAHESYLIGMGEYEASTTADMLWSQSLGNVGASVLLVSNQVAVAGIDDQDIVDRVVYGSGSFLPSGTLSVPLPPVGSSLVHSGGDFAVQSAN